MSKKLSKSLFAGMGVNMSRVPPALCLNDSRLLKIDFDLVVSDFLIHRETSSCVTFVEVGAFDGVYDDPLHDYVRNYEWSGLLIEPQPFFYEELLDAYSDRQDLMFYNGAVSFEDGSRTLYTADPETEGLPQQAGAYASFDRGNLLKDSPIPEEQICEQRVQTENLMSLIKRHDLLDVDIIQVDVEGYDANIIRMIDFDLVNPNTIQFEHLFISAQDHLGAVDILISNGYKITASGESGNDTLAYKRPK
ncbi:FkbM family methyltransferase [Salinibacter ruber]|uniref:FkbM family methyltransferase n=1 Tax=Salinibacter ruber TaxID=146919 RepID=UPI002167FA6F|nr:FkbM family methyltransferase [Salinibacter ruber]MCS3697426.1 FkbM family methyltransferase [Salinibacter ruber]